MSGQGHEEELKGIEAELASLTPRTGRLDPGFRSLLAREATLSAEIGADGAVCPCCGRSSPRGLKRWAWPGAFSAMSAIAATLLGIVVVRPAPRTAEAVIAPAPVQAPDVQAKSPAAPVQPPGDTERPWPGRYASVGWVSRPDVDGFGEPSYLRQSYPLPSGPEPDIATTPLSSRELLERLLKEPLASGEIHGAAGPERVKPSGAKT